MLFKRRQKPSPYERLRLAVWPRHSWWRSLRYTVHRITRLTATPHAIAGGVAAGVFASFTPFLGLHIFIGVAIAFAVGGSMLAAALATAFGNPLTFPLIWAATYKVGAWFLYGQSVDLSAAAAGKIVGETSFWFSIDQLLPFIGPMSLGALALGLPAAVCVYVTVRLGVRGYRARRNNRFHARRRTPS